MAELTAAATRGKDTMVLTSCKGGVQQASIISRQRAPIDCMVGVSALVPRVGRSGRRDGGNRKKLKMRGRAERRNDVGAHFRFRKFLNTSTLCTALDHRLHTHFDGLRFPVYCSA